MWLVVIVERYIKYNVKSIFVFKEHFVRISLKFISYFSWNYNLLYYSNIFFFIKLREVSGTVFLNSGRISFERNIYKYIYIFTSEKKNYFSEFYRQMYSFKKKKKKNDITNPIL